MPKPPARSPFALFTERIVREPMIHFLLIGAAVFGLQSLRSEPAPPDSENGEHIVVTPGRVEQLAQVFAKTWQRPPTPAELRGLVDAFVKEEVYYREALKLGLDRDDTLIRRRMQQKMEFLIEPDEDVLTATDARLQAYLEANRDMFRIEPKAAFEQVFVKPSTEGPPTASRAGRILADLRQAAPGAAPGDFGDRTLLPAEMPLTSLDGIARNFGRAFADALATLPRGEWAGPVRSPLGLHIVRITEYRAGFDPPLADIREVVERSWREAQRRDHMKSEYERLKAKYEIILPFPAETAGTE